MTGEIVKAYWQDVHTRKGVGTPLGRIEYRHVHEYGSVHQAQIVAPPNKGWFSTPGERPSIQIFCLTCGAEMGKGDRIDVIFEI